MFIFIPLFFHKTWNMNKRKYKSRIPVRFWDQNKRPCTFRESTGRLPNIGKLSAHSFMERWSRQGSVPSQVTLCMRQGGSLRLDLASAAWLQHLLPEHWQPFPSCFLVLQTPLFRAAMCGTLSQSPAPSSLLAQCTSCPSRTRSIRLWLQEKPLPES